MRPVDAKALRVEPELAEVIPLYLLPRGSQPRPYDRLEYETVNEFRHLTCETYSGCLNFAVRCNWSGFHCLRCPRFAEPAPADKACAPCPSPPKST